MSFPEHLFWQAIRHLGGHINAARVMRFRTARQPRRRWRDFGTVVAELRLFMDTQPAPLQDRMPTNVELLQVRALLRLHPEPRGAVYVLRIPCAGFVLMVGTAQ